MVQYIIERGYHPLDAIVDKSNSWTALEVAVSNQRLDLVSKLVELGASPSPGAGCIAIRLGCVAILI